MKKNSKFFFLSSLLLLTSFSAVAMSRYTPRSLLWVPYGKGMISSVNSLSPLRIGRPEFYGAAVILKGLHNWRQAPTTVGQMVLVDAGYEGCSALFKSAGKDLEDAPEAVKTAVLHGSRIAAYALAQETARRIASSSSDPWYYPNMRFMVRQAGEEITTDAIWSGVKMVSEKSGFTGWLQNVSCRVANFCGLNKSLGTDEGKSKNLPLIDTLGRAFVRGSVVRPAFDYAFNDSDVKHERLSFGFSIGACGFNPYIGFGF